MQDKNQTPDAKTTLKAIEAHTAAILKYRESIERCAENPTDDNAEAVMQAYREMMRSAAKTDKLVQARLAAQASKRQQTSQ